MTSETHQGRGNGLVGSMLEGRYRVDSLIARGGMSTVYRGLDTRLERPVALKVMDERYSGDRSFVERFEREARSAAKLHHNDIVAVFDQGVDHGSNGDRVFLVMELVEGCTLRDLIVDRGGPLPLAVVLSVLQPLLSALAVARPLSASGWQGPRIMNTAGLRGYHGAFAQACDGWIYIDMHSDSNRTLNALRERMGHTLVEIGGGIVTGVLMGNLVYHLLVK